MAVHFDGYGDGGTTEEVKCYDGEWYAPDDPNQSNTTPRILRNTSKLLRRSVMRTIAEALGCRPRRQCTAANG